MKLTNTALKTLGIGFQATFKNGLGMATPQHELVATKVTSTTGKEEYGWLGKFPGIREWIGERVLNNLTKSDYAIKNRDFELTIGVERNDIEDDNLGIYTPLFEELGRHDRRVPVRARLRPAEGRLRDQVLRRPVLLRHRPPGARRDGNVQSVANTDGGAGAAWYLPTSAAR
jgi:hypothetical protein